MMKRFTILTSVVSTTSFALCFALSITMITMPFSALAYAATAEITWTNYEKYRDIHSGNSSRKSFRERLFSHFEKHFNQLAKKLPDNQVLKIQITDLDLAGDVYDGGLDRIRVVKPLYSPRMNFSYQLETIDSSEVDTAEVKLNDLNFMINNRLRYRHDFIGYEKKMLDDWFFKTFKEQLSKPE